MEKALRTESDEFSGNEKDRILGIVKITHFFAYAFKMQAFLQSQSCKKKENIEDGIKRNLRSMKVYYEVMNQQTELKGSKMRKISDIW